MRKTREILRLRLSAGLKHRQIARSCKVSPSTVSDCLSRFRTSGLAWPLPDDLDDAELERRLYRQDQGPPPDRTPPDWAWVTKEMRKPHVTAHLLWQEYKQEHPDGYQYSWFCHQYAAVRSRLDPVMRQEHKLGEKCFVDYAGPTFSIVNPVTGEVRSAALFIGTLGASNYTFADVSWSQDLASWLTSHVRMFKYFGGTTEITVPDNLKSGVTKPCYYDPELNPAYHELGLHYSTAIIPARVRKPKDKAKVENSVLIAERWIMASLRNRTFYSLDELHEAVMEKLEALNNRPFQKMAGSRRSVFLEEEKAHLRPLPSEPYYFADWKSARVQMNYHIEIDHHFYSVPHELLREQVEVRFTAHIVEVLHNGRRVASHKRSWRKGGYTTLAEHMPERHRKRAEWTPERLLSWAGSTGPQTAALVLKLLESVLHPEQAFRACLGVMRLSTKYGVDRLEAACARALAARAYRYKSVASILEKGLDKVPLVAPRSSVANTIGDHDNVRGAQYYDRERTEITC
jgi:transposase